MATEQPKPREINEVLTDIADDAKRASATIDRLRTLFRKEHAERAAVDINALIDDVLDLLRGDMRANMSWCGSSARRGATVRARRSIQLRQVVMNLSSTLERPSASTEGGPREIRIAVSQPDTGQVAVAIRDSGVGVSASELERIFEHFVSSKPQGLGMGLAISRSIVEAHGGTHLGDSQRGPRSHAARRAPGVAPTGSAHLFPDAPHLKGQERPLSPVHPCDQAIRTARHRPGARDWRRCSTIPGRRPGRSARAG